MRVAIVGAGSAGMAMAKQLVDVGCSSFVVFERRSEVGGIWQHDAEVPSGYLAWEDDRAQLYTVASSSKAQTNGVRHINGDRSPSERRRLRYGWAGKYTPGPMFDGLRTNIPSDLMAYRDAPFHKSASLFPSRGTTQAYLEDYATKHDLRRHVRFGTAILRIRKESRDVPWIVTSQPVAAEESLANGDTMVDEEFTHLVLAHGRCNTPNIPNIPGLETFTGRVTHSQWYRDPTKLMQAGEKRRVLVVGNASSAMDISRELSGYLTRTLPCGLDAEQWAERCREEPFDVLQSWHDPEKGPPMDYSPLDPEAPAWAHRIQVVARIERIEGPRIFLADGKVLEDVPLILFGTGFLFDNAFMDQSMGPLRTHPLLPPSSSPTRQGFPSSSLYNMDDWLLMHSHDESLAILGMPITVVPFPIAEVQSCYVAHRWLGRAQRLPCVDQAFPPNDTQRWTSRAGESGNHQPNGEVNGDGVILHTQAHVFGTPSDIVYTDELLRMIQAVEEERNGSTKGIGRPAPWTSDYEKTSDGKGDGTPRGPELLYATSPWRIERRKNGKELRRAALGY